METLFNKSLIYTERIISLTGKYALYAFICVSSF